MIIILKPNFILNRIHDLKKPGILLYIHTKTGLRKGEI